MGLNPDWTQPRLGLNPDRTELRMGLNPDWTQPRLDWTQNGTEFRLGLNLEFLSTSNMVYNGVYQKNVLKMRVHTSDYFSQRR